MAAKKENEKLSNDNSEGNSRTRISGSKLARRARSFKDDFFDKISSIRSPGNMSNGSRCNSPKLKNRNRSKSPKRLGSAADSYDSGLDNPLKDLECQVKQVQFALRYFQDVISKNKLEMLPGNGTIVLETIANIHSVLKSYALDEQSSLIVSGLNQVYQSVARLIKLCDDLLILGEKALNREYVTETIHLVEDAVQNLVTVAGDKISERENRSLQSESSTSSRCSTVSSDPSHYRVSLPEIVMSPNERQLLEQTTQCVIERHLLSRVQTQDTSDTPPPKPPLPNRTLGESPPPLPPKKRNVNTNVTNTIPVVPTSLSLERLSIKSDNSSVGSFDSSSGGLRADLSNEDSAMPVRMTRERISSSSSSGFMSLRNSSHCYAEQQQQQRSFLTTSSSVDGVVVTTSHSESHCTATSRVVSHFTNFSSNEVPPALPLKTRKMNHELMHLQRGGSLNNHSTCSDGVVSNGHNIDSGSPPPLPLKKKHIMAYMEMFGNCSHGNTTEFLRHSVHTYSLLQAEWQKHEMMLSSAQSCSFDVFCSSQSNINSLNESSSPPPALPPRRSQLNSVASSQSPTSTLTPTSPVQLSQAQMYGNVYEDKPKSPSKNSPISKEFINGIYQDSIVEINAPDPLAEVDVSQWLVFKRPDEDGPDIRGGHADALIVLATKANKNEESDADFLYQEAFLTTYRTFITPIHLIEKLIDRYHRFDTPSDAVRQRVARESFSLLVRVIGDLTIMDLEDQVVEMLMEFVYQLLCSGDLLMGKALRIKLLEKYLAKLHYYSLKSLNGSLASQNIYTRQSTLLDFKSEHIAEQMTLLDAELFTSIEIPEVLIWTQEQNEEKSPNLTRFTEHFNKMSYWARSRILEQNDAKERERYVMKFIKIMKHLRKMNNFNSYLALLSALDSAPIRRLEWQKHITDGLKEYCALIDSSSSFRAYRQALAETQPPCIPYIGLVLQDLTFVHIGNNDFLSDGVINFSKRWQQFNIVENMKRFKKVSYNFKGHERIVAFFSNFDEFLCEEAMWQISESIKPRGGKKNNQK